jgi:ferritin-like metal-binding protein YciE
MAAEPVPDIVTTLAPVLAATDPSDHPLLIAMLERWAGERYREWADAVGEIAAVTALTACAEREDEIATRVESLYSDAADVQDRLEKANPLLKGALGGAFTWRPLDEQFATQAAAERLGAATWRSFARSARTDGDDHAADVFEQCALMEEASAEVLESLLA